MKSNQLRVLFGIAILALCAVALPGKLSAREWTRKSDGKKLQATFVALEGDVIKLKLANGQEVPVQKDLLVPADFEAAQRFAKIGDDSLTVLSARKIDGMLAQTLVKQGFKSFNEALPDDLFVRRVYLDIIGRIPTRAEFLRFAESAREDKRAALIDELLSSPGYASNLFNYFGDMYRLNCDADFNNGVRMEPYIQWWKDSLAQNKHYDQIVREMITATGNLGQAPASGFLLRDAGMEFDAFSNFGQVMLGIDISCAQCHDHPFEDWTQDDFYSMAAFFGETQRTLARYNVEDGMSMVAAKMPGAPEDWLDKFDEYAFSQGIPKPKADPAGYRQFGYFKSFLGWNVADIDGRVTPVPSNIGHDMAGKVFDPGTLIGDPAKKGGKTSREALADWLTDVKNPRFALVIANRMWARAFGRGLVEPVHDFSEDAIKNCSQPQALAFVANEMRRVNYDLREFMRILYNTRAYQSVSTGEEPDAANQYFFQGPLLRRMRAEQAWDSLSLLEEGPEIDSRKGRDGSFLKELLNVDFEKDSMESIFAKYKAWQGVRGERMGLATVAEPGTLTPSQARNDGLRASEMKQPADPASMLDTFGQSDRMVTDQHNYDGSVPQVLALMNGTVTAQLTGSSSKLVEDLESLDGPDDKVRGVFFTLLSRFPSSDELNLGMKMLEDYGDDGIRDLGWALMNGPEFLYIQ
ncbi:MAG: DUF1549 domain-containing protein [Verrucomicrobiae bacterium]|nr:DUF1549 domain-containing protein [Verrucomicrobiae bacterium]